MTAARAKRAIARAKVENVMVLALSGTCTVRYAGGRMRSIEVALDGMKPPLVLTIDDGGNELDGAVGFTHPDGTEIVVIEGDDAVEAIRELGRYIALSAGADPDSAERLTR